MRRRITALVAATTTVVLLAFLVPAAYLVAQVAQRTERSQAQTQVQALIPLVQGDAARAAAGAERSRAQGFPAWITVPGAETLGTDPAGGRLDVGGDRADVRDVDAAGGGAVCVQPVGRADGVRVIRVLAPDRGPGAGVVRIRVVLGVLGLVLFLAALLVADRLARSLRRRRRRWGWRSRSGSPGRGGWRVRRPPGRRARSPRGRPRRGRGPRWSAPRCGSWVMTGASGSGEPLAGGTVQGCRRPRQARPRAGLRSGPRTVPGGGHGRLSDPGGLMSPWSPTPPVRRRRWRGDRPHLDLNPTVRDTLTATRRCVAPAGAESTSRPSRPPRTPRPPQPKDPTSL